MTSKLLDVRDAGAASQTLATLTEAQTWRVDAQHGVRRGTVRASRPTTVNEAADALIAGMESAHRRTRGPRVRA